MSAMPIDGAAVLRLMADRIDKGRMPQYSRRGAELLREMAAAMEREQSSRMAARTAADR